MGKYQPPRDGDENLAVNFWAGRIRRLDMQSRGVSCAKLAMASQSPRQVEDILRHLAGTVGSDGQVIRRRYGTPYSRWGVEEVADGRPLRLAAILLLRDLGDDMAAFETELRAEGQPERPLSDACLRAAAALDEAMGELRTAFQEYRNASKTESAREENSAR